MKEMTAKAYIKAINKICDFEDLEGHCQSKDTEGNTPVCPLNKYGCGIPKDSKDIEAVLKVVSEYKTPSKGNCWNCGADLKGLRETPKIKYCPFCGEEMREMQ